MSLKQIARDMKLGGIPPTNQRTPCWKEAAVRIEALEAALRKIAIHNDNIAKTIRAATKEKGA